MVRTPPEEQDDDEEEEEEEEEKPEKTLQSVNDVWVITHAKQVGLSYNGKKTKLKAFKT